jgi:hypothetical protein
VLLFDGLVDGDGFVGLLDEDCVVNTGVLLVISFEEDSALLFTAVCLLLFCFKEEFS